MPEQQKILSQLASLAASADSVVALWLYGSRAKGTASFASDYDLAVMFDSQLSDRFENRLRPELLAEEWRKELGLKTDELSLLDINIAPLPIAYNAINGNLIYSKENSHRMERESIIMSKVELDLQYHLDHFETRYKNELDELADILDSRNWSSIEYRACERTLQVSIEACIGVSKHWCRKLTKRSPIDAYDAFELLSQFQKIPLDKLPNWRKIVGLRNALVHDYLNIDPEIVRSVVQNRYYNEVFEFIELGLSELNKEDN